VSSGFAGVARRTEPRAEKTGADRARETAPDETVAVFTPPPLKRVTAGGAAGDTDESTTPRYLASALESGPRTLIQRQEDTSLPQVPRYQLTPPSMLQPRDPYARFRPDFGNRLRLDPDLELRMLALGRTLVSPASVLSSAASVAPVVPVRPPTSPSGGASGGPAAPSTPPQPTRQAPAQPATPPGPPSPESETPRPGGAGDVLGAVMKVPQVSLLLEDVQNQFTSGFSRYWRSASLGEQIGFVGGSVLVGGSTLAPVLGFEESRNFVLPLLNDVVIPIPKLPGYGLEFRFGERDVMVGAHLDVGRLLPSLWGFGEASFSPIGGPPGSDPNALPPLSRKAEGGAGGGEAAPLPSAGGPRSVAEGVRGRSGGGAALEEGVRGQLEPRVATDLSRVRLHTDSGADALARTVHAHAFTSGRDIFFRSGRYAPGSRDGRRLLTHEVVHVSQQSRGAVPLRHGAAGLHVSEPGDVHEREADAVSERLTSGDAESAPVE
jgi:hypothetical protein